MDIYQKKHSLPIASKKRFGTEKFISSNYFYSGQKKSAPLEKKHLPFKKILLIAISFLLFLAIIGGGFFLWKIHSLNKSIHSENNQAPSFLKSTGSVVSSLVFPKKDHLKKDKEGRVNILLLGRAGDNKPGKNLTDTIMIMSLNTQNKKIGLLSLPRDLYVRIPETNLNTKINSVYQFGLENQSGLVPLLETIRDISGLEINYFLLADFDGFIQVIDDIGGINVEVERDIYDPRYPGPNYSYETFRLEKGLQKLDGSTALKYVRERHDDPEGDFGRAKRQQKVIQAVKNKIFSLKTFLNPIRVNDILSALSDNIQTNVQFSEVEDFIVLAKEIDTQNISTVAIDAWKKESLLKVSHVETTGGRAFILVPRAGNYSEIRDLAANLFDLEKIKRRQKEIADENASVAILNRSHNKQLGEKIKKLLENKLETNKVILKMKKNHPFSEKTLVFAPQDSSKIFTLDEISKIVPASIAKTENATMNFESDLILILGQDLEKNYSLPETTPEEMQAWEKTDAEQQDYFQPLPENHD